MKINLNDYVKVKLTEHGKNIYECSLYNTEKIEGDVLKIQIWQLMFTFGGAMFMGNVAPPFESMDVEIERVT